MLRWLRSGLLALPLLFATACNRAPATPSPAPPPALKSPFSGFTSARYKDPKMWLCLPGRADPCSENLDATEILPDLSRVVVRDRPSPHASKVDCFYVYPTVDMDLAAANHEDFGDTTSMARATVAQAARFRSVCRLFVPLYRQITIGTYLRKPEVKKAYTDVAASDVLDAFLHYMGQENGGRKVVLIGHSQGGEMVARLVQRLFDHDPVMRERLLLAMPIGWPLDVAKGRTTGGTFENVPLCTKPGEVGCVIAYRSYPEKGVVGSSRTQPAPGKVGACVNPADLVHNPSGSFSRAFFPVEFGSVRSGDATTPFVLLRDHFTGRCVDGPNGERGLVVSERRSPNDARKSPVDLSSVFFRGAMGLHVLDVQFAQGDLVDLVSERAAALP